MKLVFAGTPGIAATVLKHLLVSKQEILAVLTQPDRPSGRGQKLLPSPVKELALSHQLPVYQPLSLKEPEIQKLLKDYQADLMIVVAYGLIIPQAVLDIPKFGCWNVHVSLLPRWRGAAPIQRAIEAGDSETGVTLMQMDKGLDTGPILLQEKLAITPDMTGGLLHDVLAEMGAKLLLKGLKLKLEESLLLMQQPETGMTYAAKLSKSESQIDWSQSATEIECKIRAFNPWPICFTTYNDEPIRIWKAHVTNASKMVSKHVGQIISITSESLEIQTGRGVLEILEIQRPAGKILSMQTFLNGHLDFFKEGAIFL